MPLVADAALFNVDDCLELLGALQGVYHWHLEPDGRICGTIQLHPWDPWDYGSSCSPLTALCHELNGIIISRDSLFSAARATDIPYSVAVAIHNATVSRGAAPRVRTRLLAVLGLVDPVEVAAPLTSSPSFRAGSCQDPLPTAPW
jgi:hypothetical protein